MNNNININDSDIKPELTFRNLCFMYMKQLNNFPYIEKDFDAVTDYQLLCLVVKHLNKVIDNNNKQNESITNLYNAFIQLQNYMNNSVQDLEDAFNTLNDYVRDYFENLDVQDEINNKLDQMLEDGVLEQIIEQFIQSTALWCFDTVENMRQATNLIEGSYAKTLGYYSVNDGGGGTYRITETESETEYQEELESGLYATLILNKKGYYAKQFGSYGDGVHDDTNALQNAINFISQSKGKGILNLGIGKYKITDTLSIPRAIKIVGEYEKGTVIINDITGIFGTEIKQATSGKDIFKCTGTVGGLEISKLRLNGNGGIGINSNSVNFTEFIIEKIHFNGGFEKAISIQGSIGRISDCDFSANDIGLEIGGTSLTINNNNFWNNSVAQIKINSLSDSLFINNWIERTLETGDSILLQSPVTAFYVKFENCQIRDSYGVPLKIDGITNITSIMNLKYLQFNNCCFASYNRKHAIEVRMKDNGVTNSTSGNNNRVQFNNCSFRNIPTYALSTDFKYLYWTFTDCNYWTSWESGNGNLYNTTGVNPDIINQSTFKGLTTNGNINFENTPDDYTYGTNNSMFLQNNSLKFRDNTGTKLDIQFSRAGNTSSRPASPSNGTVYFDSSLGKPIFYNNGYWYYADGTIVT